MPRVLTYRICFCTHFLADPIPAPDITRFVVRSGELLNSKYGRSAIEAERTITFRLCHRPTSFTIQKPKTLTSKADHA